MLSSSSYCKHPWLLRTLCCPFLRSNAIIEVLKLLMLCNASRHNGRPGTANAVGTVSLRVAAHPLTCQLWCDGASAFEDVAGDKRPTRSLARLPGPDAPLQVTAVGQGPCTNLLQTQTLKCTGITKHCTNHLQRVLPSCLAWGLYQRRCQVGDGSGAGSPAYN